jgi:inosine-uridine nucleoside N-ribohydrolase
MGEVRDPDGRYEDPLDDWRALREHAERYRDLGMGPIADELARTSPPPTSRRHTPVIIDTDLGGDPDDAIALTCAARAVPELALVVTSDEHGDGDRARFARHLLDLNDRPDVAVVTGAALGDTRYWVADGLTPADVPAQTDDLVQAVRKVVDSARGPVRWIGMGPLTNLARVLTDEPDLLDRLAITQTGGALRYRDPTRATHNFRLDPAAAVHVVRSASELHLVLSEITTHPDNAVTSDSTLYRRLASPEAPEWARLLRVHLDRWFAAFTPATMQHDPLTLTAALELPFVLFTLSLRFTIEQDARMYPAADGHTRWLSAQADYAALHSWIGRQLSW